MEVQDLSNLPPADLQALRIAMGSLRTLGDLLYWVHDLKPPVSSPIVVTQDEFTHDVLVPYPGGRWLDFDTT